MHDHYIKEIYEKNAKIHHDSIFMNRSVISRNNVVWCRIVVDEFSYFCQIKKNKVQMKEIIQICFLALFYNFWDVILIKFSIYKYTYKSVINMYNKDEHLKTDD